VRVGVIRVAGRLMAWPLRRAPRTGPLLLPSEHLRGEARLRFFTVVNRRRDVPCASSYSNS